MGFFKNFISYLAWIIIVYCFPGREKKQIELQQFSEWHYSFL